MLQENNIWMIVLVLRLFIFLLMQAPAGYIIKMTVDDLHMAYNPDTLRCYHWLEIQYNLPGQPGIR